jgi:hypothetical protein
VTPLRGCTTGTVKTDEIAGNRREVSETDRRADAVSILVPRAATQHSGCARIWPQWIRWRRTLIISFAVPVLHPFPNIACHIVGAVKAFSCFISTYFGCVTNILIVIQQILIRRIIPPRIDTSIRTARGFFPLDFRE